MRKQGRRLEEDLVEMRLAYRGTACWRRRVSVSADGSVEAGSRSLSPASSAMRVIRFWDTSCDTRSPLISNSSVIFSIYLK